MSFPLLAILGLCCLAGEGGGVYSMVILMQLLVPNYNATVCEVISMAAKVVCNHHTSSHLLVKDDLSDISCAIESACSKILRWDCKLIGVFFDAVREIKRDLWAMGITRELWMSFNFCQRGDEAHGLLKKIHKHRLSNERWCCARVTQFSNCGKNAKVASSDLKKLKVASITEDATFLYINSRDNSIGLLVLLASAFNEVERFPSIMDPGFWVRYFGIVRVRSSEWRLDKYRNLSEEGGCDNGDIPLISNIPPGWTNSGNFRSPQGSHGFPSTWNAACIPPCLCNASTSPLLN
ncbi:hypothetical protein BDK51DRAFT_26951 [Blyttiomyces helicus]|uniref:Uncharacterized protein n=1 Tax=Blyttiomyces helicus TaxID=388810 RepID=A0A4P9WRD5_9FUNG|nr:hypothetical protein BDK51DRAFT_26951 [Blyttiomyces helicus]|eukprot:RKO93466.1 hypothetical protein BDK51DRAFT_26951 [Blyttiomyces helicus]